MKAYASDLSDAEWSILEPLIPPAKPSGRPRSVNMRQILNGIFYLLRSGGAWRLLPHEYPAWSTVYDYFRKWRNAGIWEEMVRTLRERLREQSGRQATPSAGMIDSQSVKTRRSWRPAWLRWRQKSERTQTAPARRYDGLAAQGRGAYRQSARS